MSTALIVGNEPREHGPMAKKTPTKGANRSRVTFELPSAAGKDAATVHLVGDFSDWSKTATPLTSRKDGRFSVTLTLDNGRSYRYRYLVDGARWENDWSADAYVANEFGEDDSVLEL